MLSAGLRAELPEAARSRHEERASALVGFLREAREAAVNWTSLEIHPKKVLKWNKIRAIVTKDQYHIVSHIISIQQGGCLLCLRHGTLNCAPDFSLTLISLLDFGPLAALPHCWLLLEPKQHKL